jgi:hypothetical protein
MHIKGGEFPLYGIQNFENRDVFGYGDRRRRAMGKWIPRVDPARRVGLRQEGHEVSDSAGGVDV